MSAIALLGWGSLLWDGGREFDQWHEPWRYDGPTLRIEFSRLSSTRNGALTLVIDTENGAPVRVAWCRSKRTTIVEAVSDLAAREQTSTRHVGLVEMSGRLRCQDAETSGAIQDWAAERDCVGVVWTDLRSNFTLKRGEPFSVDAAINYLNSLEGVSRMSAVEYLKKAPSFVQTRLREAVQRLGMAK